MQITTIQTGLSFPFPRAGQIEERRVRSGNDKEGKQILIPGVGTKRGVGCV